MVRSTPSDGGRDIEVYRWFDTYPVTICLRNVEERATDAAYRKRRSLARLTALSGEEQMLLRYLADSIIHLFTEYEQFKTMEPQHAAYRARDLSQRGNRGARTVNRVREDPARPGS